MSFIKFYRFSLTLYIFLAFWWYCICIYPTLDHITSIVALFFFTSRKCTLSFCLQTHRHAYLPHCAYIKLLPHPCGMTCICTVRIKNRCSCCYLNPTQCPVTIKPSVYTTLASCKHLFGHFLFRYHIFADDLVWTGLLEFFPHFRYFEIKELVSHRDLVLPKNI